MRRADRLLQIVQVLRRHGRPVTAQALAAELEVSRRTIYRDILDLQAARVPIDGEAGVGYILRPGYDLPPLMFTVEEVEAIVLGARLVRKRGDVGLARAAEDVMAKVAAVLPSPLALALERTALLVRHPFAEEEAFGPHMALLRRSVRDRDRLHITYENGAALVSERVVWPLALLFYPQVTLLGAWCELRGGYRFFRTDRIAEPTTTGRQFDDRNGALLKELMASHD